MRDSSLPSSLLQKGEKLDKVAQVMSLGGLGAGKAQLQDPCDLVQTASLC